jgi:chromosome segregation ATPase
MSWNILHARKAELERYLHELRQALERVERAIGQGPSDMRTLVSYIEEKRQLQSKIEITQQQISEVDGEINEIRKTIRAQKNKIKSEAERAVVEAETTYKQVCEHFERLLESLKAFTSKLEDLVNNLHGAREASKILNEDITPITALGEGTLNYVRSLVRVLERERPDLMRWIR